MTRSLQNLIENSSFQKSHCSAITSQGQHLENTGGFFFFFNQAPFSFFQLCQTVCLPSFLLNGSLIFTEDQEIEHTSRKISKPVCSSELHIVSCKTGEYQQQ